MIDPGSSSASSVPFPGVTSAANIPPFTTTTAAAGARSGASHEHDGEGSKALAPLVSEATLDDDDEGDYEEEEDNSNDDEDDDDDDVGDGDYNSEVEDIMSQMKLSACRVARSERAGERARPQQQQLTMPLDASAHTHDTHTHRRTGGSQQDCRSCRIRGEVGGSARDCLHQLQGHWERQLWRRIPGETRQGRTPRGR